MGKRTTINLTSKFIDGIKAGPKMTTYSDVTAGLELYVTKAGAKTFSFRYTLEDGTRRRLNIGRWPGKTLESARSDARGFMNDVAEGGDPAKTEKDRLSAKRAAPVKTLDDLMAALFAASRMPTKTRLAAKKKNAAYKGAAPATDSAVTATSTGLRESTLAYWGWLNKKHIAPRLGAERLEDLTARAIKAALREIGASAGGTTSNRAFALIRRAFNFGIDEEHVVASPVARVKALFEEGSRARVLTDAEIAKLWTVAEATIAASRAGANARDEIHVSRAMAIAVQLCLVTVQRVSEVSGMLARELDFDNRLWIIPKERTKAKREQVLPLTDAAIDLIKEASEFAAQRLGRVPVGADPIFPTPRVGKAPRNASGTLLTSPKPVARLSLGRAMTRLCEVAKVDNATAHDLRRTATTVMTSERIGVLSEVAARVLNHAPPGQAVTAIYNRHAYIAEKRGALTQWAALLLEIVGEQEQPSNVELIRGAA